MRQPRKNKVEASRSVISQVMDELMDETSPPEASGSTPAHVPETSSAPGPKSLGTTAEMMVARTIAKTSTTNEKGETVYARHPAPCGNERFMKSSGFYKTCVKRGTEVCPTCGLIEYCSDKCRFEHLDTHSVFCNPAYTTVRWTPSQKTYEKAIKAQETRSSYREEEFLWGVLPALDVLSMEGPAIYSKPINLLLPISNDIRNAMMTVNGLPRGYKEVCDMTLNDPTTIVVIRNALMLMTIFVYPCKYEATKTVTQLWYSAFLDSASWKRLKYELLPFIERAYAKNAKGKPTSQVSQRWTKGSASLRLTLTRRQWKSMIDILEKGDGLSFKAAVAARLAVLDADKLERTIYLGGVAASCRRPHMRFLATGMMLPFGQPVGQYDIPNPTLFSLDGEYLNHAANVPLDSWFLDEVRASGRKFNVLEHDIYHALYQHVGAKVFEFCLRLSDSNLKLNFHLYCVETSKLDGTLGNNKDHHANGLNFFQMGTYEGDDFFRNP